jgi:hypothetical protein
LREQATASYNEARTSEKQATTKRQSSERKRESSDNQARTSEKQATIKLQSSDKYVYSVAWANDQLRIAIEFLKEGAKSEGFWLWNQRLCVVILIKTELEGHGFKWQAVRIENWIHRLQPRKADLDRERERRAH